jgi:predicted transcriptional regulator of viral defense system
MVFVETRSLFTCYGMIVQVEIVMTLQELFTKHTVLTLDELQACLDQAYSRNKRSREAILSYHLREGHLVRVRRGLYAAVPPGSDPETCPVDPYLVAGKSTKDAVLAYHTALELHGKAHSLFEHYIFQSNKPVRPTIFRTYHFECSLFPKALRDKHREHFATTIIERSGGGLRVASLERTLVDVLGRPDLSGGWEEIWRSLESVEYFNLDLIVEYVRLLNNATTAAKVGYYLEQHAESLMVEDQHLSPLRELRPKQPHYLQRGKSGKLVKNWNLVVPPSLVERTWEEIA